MMIKGDIVVFDYEDMPFVEKFGIMEATDMVLDFASTNKHPFVYDTYQLAKLLGLSNKELYKLVKTCDSHYRSISIKKKNGGTRKLNAPYYLLKCVQGDILNKILCHFPISKYATAYRKGGQLMQNAYPHIGKKHLLKLDLSDFFGSIRFDQIYSAVFNTKRFPPQIGAMLTTLCCRNEVLPQGAPTSPALSNLVMRNFDEAMGKWCEKRGMSYTRYCDDITISGNSPLYVAYVKAKSMLEDMGFEINEKKTHFITNANRMTVTGLTVNEKVNIPSDYKRKLRQEVHYALKYGVEDALNHLSKTGISNSVSYYHYLMGRINYVLQIEPQNEWFRNAQWQLYECYTAY